MFGCISYAHVPSQHRKKLDDRSVKCILLSVSEESKAYRPCDLVTKRIITSRDVKFVEDEHWNWKEGTKHRSNQLIDLGDREEEEAPTQAHNTTSNAS